MIRSSGEKNGEMGTWAHLAAGAVAIKQLRATYSVGINAVPAFSGKRFQQCFDCIHQIFPGTLNIALKVVELVAFRIFQR